MDTYKPPRRKIPTSSIFCWLSSRSFNMPRTGSTKIKMSIASSTTPIDIQKMLKLKQYPPAEGPTQSRSTGIQLTIVRIVPTIHQKMTTRPISRDCRRNGRTAKIRRYMSRTEILMAAAKLKYRIADRNETLR